MIALPPPDVALSFMNLQENLPSFFPLKNDAHYAIKRIKLDQQEFSQKLLGCSLKNQRHGVTSALSFLAATVLEGSSSPQPNNNFMKQAQHDLASLL